MKKCYLRRVCIRLSFLYVFHIWILLLTRSWCADLNFCRSRYRQRLFSSSYRSYPHPKRFGDHLEEGHCLVHLPQERSSRHRWERSTWEAYRRHPQLGRRVSQNRSRNALRNDLGWFLFCDSLFTAITCRPLTTSISKVFWTSLARL